MKKSTLNFLGRKNQSLFATNVKTGELGTVDFMPASSVIPELGTASVRARPTVKHYASSDNFQGYAVPTPKVPLLPPSNGPMSNGSVGGNHLPKSSFMSVPNLEDEEIFVPPHPSVAPPPPPGAFVLPPPDFLGDLNSTELANFKAISVPVPEPMSPAQSEVKDLSFLKPPPMAPPKVPSVGPTSPPPISPTQGTVPQRPSYAPPLPPTDRQIKTEKMPPPKPIRFSSVSSLDSPPQTPAPPPPVKTPTLSTFNPQSPAKLYDSKAPGFGVYENIKPKQMFLMEDSGTRNSVPNVVPQSKPAPRDVQELKETLRSPQPSKSLIPDVKKDITTRPVETSKFLNNPSYKSPQPLKVNGTVPSLESTKKKFEASQDQNLKFSPLLDRKLRNIKAETNGPREGSAASPLALLKAAKEREKHKSVSSLTQRDADINDGQLTTSLRDFSQNSFETPQPTSYSSLPPHEERLQETLKYPVTDHTRQVLTPSKYTSPALKRSQTPSALPTLHQTASTPTPARNPLKPKQNVHESPSMSQPADPESNEDGVNVPFLPPPPEFGDFLNFTEPPPSIIPPGPPVKKAPSPPAKVYRQPQAPPPPLPKSAPAPPPKFPPPNLNVKLKPNSQTTPKPAPTQLPTALSPSQATLLSILQKKMLEMDHKISPMKEAEANSDDWGSPLSDEENNTSVAPKAKPQTKSYPVANKAATLNMKELENKLARKPQESLSVKVSSPSKGLQHQYGMTFTVRPGTRNPITIVNRGDP